MQSDGKKIHTDGNIIHQERGVNAQDKSFGVFLNVANDNEIWLKNDIHMQGMYSEGITICGSSNSILYIDGHIKTDRGNTFAVFLKNIPDIKLSQNNTIYFNGQIDAAGDTGYMRGFEIRGNHNTAYISGNIAARHTAVALSGVQNNAYIASKVEATGEQNDEMMNAILFFWGSHMVTLLPGATIIGKIATNVNSTAGNIVLDIGPSASYYYQTEGENINFLDLHKPVVAGSIASMGLSYLIDTSPHVAQLIDTLQNLSLQLAPNNQRSQILGSYYNKKLKNDAKTQERTSSGFIAGYSSPKHSLDLFLSVENSEAYYGHELSEQSQEITSYSGGANYNLYTSPKYQLAVTTLMGKSNHKPEVKLLNNFHAQGYEWLTSKYDSQYTAFGATLSAQIARPHITLDAKFSPYLTMLTSDPHQFEDYFQIQKANVSQLDVFSQVGSTLHTKNHRGNISAYINTHIHHLLETPEFDYTIQNTTTSFRPSKTRYYSYTSGIDATFIAKSQFILNAGMTYQHQDQYSQDNQNNHGYMFYCKASINV